MQDKTETTHDQTGRSPRLLACLTLTEQAVKIATETFALARLLDADLTFVHVGTNDDDARAKLAEIVTRGGGDADRYPVTILGGDPADAICGLARRQTCDLIVAGALEREGLLESLFVGSIARRIARAAHCSVLLLAKDQTPSRKQYGEVVVTVQLDEESRAMLRRVAQVARRAGAHTLHVVKELDATESLELRHMGELARGGDLRRNWVRERETRLADWVGSMNFEGVTPRLACVEAGEGVGAMEYAGLIDADLLVYPAPSRRITFFDRFFSHPSDTVLHQIQCALLFYRATPATRDA